MTQQIPTPFDGVAARIQADIESMSAKDEPTEAEAMILADAVKCRFHYAQMIDAYRQGVRAGWVTLGKAEWEPGKDSAAYMVTGKAELRMVAVDAPSYKGEHTGRAKLEYAPLKPDPSTDPGYEVYLLRWPFAWPKGWRA